MAKSYLSAEDLFKGITQELEDLEVRGLGTVQVRSLTTAEVARIQASAGEDTDKLMAGAVLHGLANPALDEEQLEALINGRAGVIMQIATRVMQLSGMTEAEALENLAGNGSRNPAGTE